MKPEKGEKDFFSVFKIPKTPAWVLIYFPPSLFRMGSPIELCISYQFMVGKPHRRADFCHVMVGSLIKGPILPHKVG